MAFINQHHTAASHELLDALRLSAGVVVAVAFHEVDNTPHRKTCAEGIKQLMAGGGVVLIGTTLIPLLSGLFG
mgnify:CR=1 FL=1